MEVTIVQKTPDMVSVISRAAGICYGKDDSSLKRIRSCYKSGHTGVLEHASVTFKVTGISRACSHQLVRHRIASYCQESQRYNRYDLSRDDWYVTPPELESNPAYSQFVRAMNTASVCYRMALENGVKPEDARFILPEAMKTSIMVTMNIRTLFYFFDLRLGYRAQWEIRELADRMASEMEKVEPELMKIYFESRNESRID